MAIPVTQVETRVLLHFDIEIDDPEWGCMKGCIYFFKSCLQVYSFLFISLYYTIFTTLQLYNLKYIKYNIKIMKHPFTDTPIY